MLQTKKGLAGVAARQGGGKWIEIACQRVAVKIEVHFEL